MEALFARAARLVKRRLRRAADGDRQDDGRRRSSPASSTASPARSTGSCAAIRRELGAEAARDRHRRAGRARRAALDDDRARRSTPHAGRPPDRLGPERVIIESHTLAVFSLAALAILAVPRPRQFCTSSRAASIRGEGAGAGVGARDPRRHALPPRVRDRVRAVGDSRLVGDGLHGRQATLGAALPRRDSGCARFSVARPRTQRIPGDRRAAAAGASVRRGRRRQRASTRRPRCSSSRSCRSSSTRPRGSRHFQILVLGLTFIALGLITDSCWALAAGSAGEALRKSRMWAQVQRYVSGSIFVGLGLVTALTGSHTRSG